MRNLWDWIYSRIGKHIEVDGIYPNQCVDLTKDYFRWLGLRIFSGNAINYAHGFHPEAFQWIGNTIWNYPEAGDIAVFAAGAYGHVGVVTSANRLTLDVFCQNWPFGNVCTIHRFNYLYPRCLGWLRPRK